MAGLGPDLLAFYCVMHMIGIIPTIIMTLLTLLAYYFTIDVFIHCYRQSPGVTSLSEIVLAKGGKILSLIFNLMFSLFLFLCLVAITLCET